MNKRRIPQRSRGSNQHIHCGNVGSRTGSQTNRFASHGFIHVHHLVEQGTVTAEFNGASRRIHPELMQAQFKLVEREYGSPGHNRIVLE